MTNGTPRQPSTPEGTPRTFTREETLSSVRALEVYYGDPRVSCQLIELARNPDSGLSDYAHLIDKDVSLTARVLGLVNSAIYTPTHHLLTVRRALGALGMKSLRVVVFSHCIASLHHSKLFRPEPALRLWRATLRKAIAARKVAECLGSQDCDATYSAALMQDVGLVLMNALDQTAMAALIEQDDKSRFQSLELEADKFGIDHEEVASFVSERIDIPAYYARAIHNHHSKPLSKSEEAEFAIGVSALLPHDSMHWSTFDKEELDAVIQAHLPQWSCSDDFYEEVCVEVARIEIELGEEAPEESRVLAALTYASQETAKETLSFVHQTSWLREDTNSLNDALDHAERAHEEAEQRADRDPLTQLFNRGGWDRRARITMNQPNANDLTVGVAFFDLDFFKELNDNHGHAAGDFFLKEISRRMTEAMRSDDLLCRWGGDEFVVLFSGSSPSECLEAARRIKENMQMGPVKFGDEQLIVSVTVGFVSVSSDQAEMNLGDLLQIADEQLYKAKSVRRGTLSFTSVRAG
ncbi:MAG: diguanylate cyclase (GGDEF)-like protein [Planctomycetota bacterium]|jgi:diguanylate cyclase (GGDEF)-like protein